MDLIKVLKLIKNIRFVIVVILFNFVNFEIEELCFGLFFELFEEIILV